MCSTRTCKLGETLIADGGTRRKLCIIVCSALNRPFAEWNEVFPNAACVVSLIDRLVHHSQIIAIEGDSYRMKEAQERASKQKRQSVKKEPSK